MIIRKKINAVNFVNVKVQIVEVERQKGEEFKVRGLTSSHKEGAKKDFPGGAAGKAPRSQGRGPRFDS